jgi:hypothetical protein
MDETLWNKLPYDILHAHILPKLSIDVRLSFDIPPNQLSKAVCDTIETALVSVKHKQYIWFQNVKSNKLRFLEIRKVIKDTEYSHHQYFVGDFDEQVYVERNNYCVLWEKQNYNWNIKKHFKDNA